MLDMSKSPHHSHWSTLLVTSRLSKCARIIGIVIALRFRNKKTGLMCPAVPKIATVSGYSASSVKRGIRELETAGWLERTDGRGTGQFTKYRLRWPEKVATLGPAPEDDDEMLQKSTNHPLDVQFSASKGSRKDFQEITDEPFYNNQNPNQKKGSAGNADQRSSSHPITSLRFISEDMADELFDWDQKLAEWNLPPIQVLAMDVTESGKTGLLWPYRWVPSDPQTLARVEAYARWLFETHFGDGAAVKRRHHAYRTDSKCTHVWRRGQAWEARLPYQPHRKDRFL